MMTDQPLDSEPSLTLSVPDAEWLPANTVEFRGANTDLILTMTDEGATDAEGAEIEGVQVFDRLRIFVDEMQVEVKDLHPKRLQSDSSIVIGGVEMVKMCADGDLKWRGEVVLNDADLSLRLRGFFAEMASLYG